MSAAMIHSVPSLNHDDEVRALFAADIVNGHDIGVIQGGGGLHAGAVKYLSNAKS
jgi:hypothetical protein